MEEKVKKESFLKRIETESFLQPSVKEKVIMELNQFKELVIVEIHIEKQGLFEGVLILIKELTTKEEKILLLFDKYQQSGFLTLD